MTSMRFLVLLGLIVLVSSDCAASELIRDPSAWNYAPLQYYDLVVVGTISQVNDSSLSIADVWMDPPEVASVTKNRQMWGVEAVVKVREVLRGPAVDPMVTVTIPIFSEDYDTPNSVGDSVMLCAQYHPRLRSYYLKSNYGKYVWKNGAWVCERTQRGTRAFSDDELRTKVDAMRPRAVADASELVVEGDVRKVVNGTIKGQTGEVADLVTVTLQVKQVLKGKYNGKAIDFVMITNGKYLPEWRRHVPDEIQPDETWLVFLKKGPQGWYPFAGSNGLLRLEGDQVVYDQRVRYWWSTSDIRQVVQRAAEGE